MPEPTRSDDRENTYVLERNVTFRHGDCSNSAGRIALYRRGHFVYEAKQWSPQPPWGPARKMEPGCYAV